MGERRDRPRSLYPVSFTAVQVRLLRQAWADAEKDRKASLAAANRAMTEGVAQEHRHRAEQSLRTQFRLSEALRHSWGNETTDEEVRALIRDPHNTTLACEIPF